MASVVVKQDSSVASNAVASWLLYSGIKNLLRCDEAETVEGIARYVISQHRSIRLAARFVELTKRTPIPALLTLLAWARSFLVVHPEGPLCGAVWIARLRNERRAIEPLIAFAPELKWTELKFQSRMCKSYEPIALNDIKRVQVVFGGNSSVLIESVTAGVPSAYINELDHGSPDLHGFVAAALIYRSEVDPDFNEMLRFYQRSGWQKILRRFANVDDNESAVLAETVKALPVNIPSEV